MNCSSDRSDHSSADLTEVDTTAVSTPLDRVPLYNAQSDKVPITLLKSSQAASSSALPREGTPAHKVKHTQRLPVQFVTLFSDVNCARQYVA